jgi:hypothetical protein
MHRNILATMNLAAHGKALGVPYARTAITPEHSTLQAISRLECRVSAGLFARELAESCEDYAHEAWRNVGANLDPEGEQEIGESYARLHKAAESFARRMPIGPVAVRRSS